MPKLPIPQWSQVRSRLSVRTMVLLVVLVLVTTGLLYAPTVVWNMRSSASLEVLVVDRTVTHNDYREHAGAIWALNHARVVDPTLQRPFDASSDYAGTVLQEEPKGTWSVSDRPIPERINALDMVYVADTYGVYEADLTPDALQGEFSPSLTPELTTTELALLESNLRAGGTFVAEFNTMASPTDRPAARNLGQVLGVSPTGWSGRHFGSLKASTAGTVSSDLPTWAPRWWEEQNGEPWSFTGPGWVLVGPETQLVVLLENTKESPSGDMEDAGMHVVFPETTRALVPGLAPVLTYDYWFDIVEPLPGTEVLGSYEMNVTTSGTKKLEAAGVPASFPAVTRFVRTDGGPSYYLAGDWADQKLGVDGDVGPYQWAGITWWNRLTVPLGRDEQRAFYWNVYQPLMQGIIEETTLNAS